MLKYAVAFQKEPDNNDFPIASAIYDLISQEGSQ